VQHLLAGYFGGIPMNTVIFNTDNALFKFTQKEVKEHLIFKHSEYAPVEIAQYL